MTPTPIRMPVRTSLRPVLACLLVAAALVACDARRIEKLQEGESTEADVRQQFGEPKLIVEKADGSKVLEYPRQPAGWTNYAIVIGPDGRLVALRQLLTPANFAEVAPGMAQLDVRSRLGEPARERQYAMKPDETVWQWRFVDHNRKKVFSVTFDRDRRVLSTETAEDSDEANFGGK